MSFAISNNDTGTSTDLLDVVNESLTRLQSIENDIDNLRARLDMIVIPESLSYTWPEAIAWFRKHGDKAQREEKLKNQVRMLKRDQQSIVELVKQHMVKEGMGDMFKELMENMQKGEEERPDS